MHRIEVLVERNSNSDWFLRLQKCAIKWYTFSGLGLIRNFVCDFKSVASWMCCGLGIVVQPQKSALVWYSCKASEKCSGLGIVV